MVTTLTMNKVIWITLCALGSLGCAGGQNGEKLDVACGDITQAIFEPSLEEKGEHTIKVKYGETTAICEFEIGDHVTPTDTARCDPSDVLLIVPANTPSDSPTQGPDDFLPIVEGVTISGYFDEVTIEVDGTSYGPLTTEHVDATEGSCEHNTATVQLD